MHWSFKDKKVLVTGAASGLGRIMARKACERGAAMVIIWDIDATGMEETATLFTDFAIPVRCYRVDLSDVEAIKKAAGETLEECGSVDVLINNAGIIIGKYFHEHSTADIERSMAINALAPMHITQAFMPGMITAGRGLICNISSSAGLIGNTRMSAYLASKWALTGWSESLRLELKQLQQKIHVLTVMPFYINTGMFEGVHSKILPILNPEKVAEKTMHAMERKKHLLAMPLPYWFIRLCQGILPLKLFDWVMEHVFGIYQSMSGFKGRV